jgi:hypothetical protein
MKVLLLYPEIPDTFWSFRHALPFLGKRFLRTPGHLGQAVTLAIMGHHFFTLTRRLESEPLK